MQENRMLIILIILWHVPRSPATRRIFCGRYLESSTRTICRNTWRRSMRSKTGLTARSMIC